MVLAVKNPPANAGDRRRRFDPWVRKIPPTQSGLAQKDQETVERDAVCIQNLLPTSFQFQGLLPLWLWELGKREGAAAAKSLQSCLTLCDPIDGSPPGSPIPGILQARVLEGGAIAFSSQHSPDHRKSKSIPEKHLLLLH